MKRRMYVRPEVDTVVVEQSEMLCVSGTLATDEAHTPGYAREMEMDEPW